MAVHNYHKLDVWHRATDLVTEVYRFTATLPVDERYGLTSQLRRAAVSAPSNIAEGSAFEGSAAFRRHLRIAVGSLCEVETQLLVCSNLGFAARTDVSPLLRETGQLKRMLVGLIKKHS